MNIYDDTAWFKCSKEIIKDENLSQSAKWLYVVLSALNNHYGGKHGYFSRTNEKLIEDSGLSAGTLKKAKKELVDNGYIRVIHNQLWEDEEKQKSTTFRICYYELLK